MNYPEADQIAAILNPAQKVVIIQADNPDADSLGSALALEHIVGDMGKDTYLYCGAEMPGYLRYLSGWDRVQQELPSSFDISIIVDASTMTLLEKLANSGKQGWLAAKPCIVLDHHATTDHPIPFATLTINDGARSSAGELIYMLAQQLDWPLSVAAQTCLMTSILGDTQGLSNQLTSAETYRIMANFTDAGVDRTALEELRREAGKMPPEIFKYKAALIDHTELADNGRIATVLVPQAEINQYSPLYNPGPLVQNDMLQTASVQLAIVFKTYDDGRITAAIRGNIGAPVAGKLAERFGGGGHDFAAGFKITDGRSFDELKSECITFAAQLLDTLDKESTHEPLQHTY